MNALHVSVVLLLLAPLAGMLLLLSSVFPTLRRARLALVWLAIAALVLGLTGTLCSLVFGLGFV
jgi:hypothetical protein